MSKLRNSEQQKQKSTGSLNKTEIVFALNNYTRTHFKIMHALSDHWNKKSSNLCKSNSRITSTWDATTWQTISLQQIQQIVSVFVLKTVFLKQNSFKKHLTWCFSVSHLTELHIESEVTGSTICEVCVISVLWFNWLKVAKTLQGPASFQH